MAVKKANEEEAREGKARLNRSQPMTFQTAPFEAPRPHHRGAADSTLKPGARVQVNFQGEGDWFAATIREVHDDGTVDLLHDDGDTEASVRELAFFGPPSAPAPPT